MSHRIHFWHQNLQKMLIFKWQKKKKKKKLAQILGEGLKNEFSVKAVKIGLIILRH